MRKPPKPIKITILTGFLGAGKTTILNQILHDERFENTMVIINEFGDVGLDHLLVENTDSDMLVMSSGCICCSIRGDLVTTFEKILRDIDNGRVKAIDHIIIETTGIASPGPIISSFMSHRYLNMRFNLNQVITIADATNILNNIQQFDEAKQQLGMADKIIISKSDLMDAESLNQVMDKLLDFAANANVVDKQKIDMIEHILNPILSQHKHWSQNVEHHGHKHHHKDEHGAINALSFAKVGAYNQVKLWNFLDILRSEYGKNILRIKAVVAFEDAPEQAFAIHAVQHLLFPAKALDIEFSGVSELVIIGTALEKDKINALYNAFLGQVAPDMPDLQAVEDNPLGLLGMGHELLK